MNTLPTTRSVNTFRCSESKTASVSNLRHLKANSLYIPTNDCEEVDCQAPLLTDTNVYAERRTQTLGRTQPKKTGRKNQTNPLFDSVGSLDQPWFQNYATTFSLSATQSQTTTQPTPQISVPTGSYIETGTFATARDLQPVVRVPLSRSSGRTSPYSAGGQHTKPSSVRESYDGRSAPNTCMSCPKPCFEKESNPYTLPDYPGSNGEGLAQSAHEVTKPWVVCLLTVSTVFDVFLMTILTVVVFFLNCSTDGWFYSDRRIQSICTHLWSDWIPLHHRNFRCPALPPGYEDPNAELTNQITQRYLNRFHPSAVPPMVPTSPLGAINQEPFKPEPSLGLHSFPDAWDADLGLMPPPKLKPSVPDPTYLITTTRLYGPTYEPERQHWWNQRDMWLRLNPVSPYGVVTTDSVIIGCIIIPLVTIIVIEITAACLSCCCWPIGRKRGHRHGQIQHVIGRLYRLIVTYIFGILTVLLIVLILKSAVGRLRPNFITICQPTKSVCPRWASLLQASGYHYFSEDGREDQSTNPQILSFLAQESARQGFILVPKTTTPNPEVTGAKTDKGLLSDSDCAEKRVLRLKYARTSFPSLNAAVTMYATIFTAAYITYTLRYLRRTCFCIPLSLLLGGCLANVFIGLGRVVLRENWLQDVLAGWVFGIIIAFYMLYRALHSTQNRKGISNEDIKKQLGRLQELIQSNNEYRHDENKFMKYL